MTILRQLMQITAVLALLLVAPSCGNGPVNWPEVAKCAPDTETLVGTVTEILLVEGDWHGPLEELAREHGPESVVCAALLLKQSWMGAKGQQTPQREQALARVNAFLEKIGTKVE